MLTEDGTEGYTFGEFLPVFESFGDPRAEAARLQADDPGLERALRTAWRPEEFLSMVNRRRFDLLRLRPEYGLFPDPEAGVFRLVTAQREREFPYRAVERVGDGRYVLATEGGGGSPARFTLRGNGALAFSYVDEGRLVTEVFVDLQQEVEELIAGERGRRERLFAALLERGPRLRSGGYGTIELTGEGRFRWQGYEALVPRWVPDGLPGTGVVDFRYALGAPLRGAYDTVVTLLFDDRAPTAGTDAPGAGAGADAGRAGSGLSGSGVAATGAGTGTQGTTGPGGAAVSDAGGSGGRQSGGVTGAGAHAAQNGSGVAGPEAGAGNGTARAGPADSGADAADTGRAGAGAGAAAGGETGAAGTAPANSGAGDAGTSVGTGAAGAGAGGAGHGVTGAGSAATGADAAATGRAGMGTAAAPDGETGSAGAAPAGTGAGHAGTAAAGTDAAGTTAAAALPGAAEEAGGEAEEPDEPEYMRATPWAAELTLLVSYDGGGVRLTPAEPARAALEVRQVNRSAVVMYFASSSADGG